MVLRCLRFLSLLLTALAMGITVCHVLEIWGKLRLPPEVWITVQQNLYAAFAVGGAVFELGAILTAALVAFLVRHHRRAVFLLSLAGAGCALAGLVSWFILVAPVNEVIAAAAPERLPPDWAAVRRAWEAGHAVGAAFFILAFSLLLWALLMDTRPDGVAPAGTRRHR
jgi:hypothetical protein